MFSYSLFFKMDFRTLFLNSFCIFSILFIFSVIFNYFPFIFYIWRSLNNNVIEEEKKWKKEGKKKEKRDRKRENITEKRNVA